MTYPNAFRSTSLIGRPLMMKAGPNGERTASLLAVVVMFSGTSTLRAIDAAYLGRS